MSETIFKVITPRTVIRCYTEADAMALNDALIDSNSHLRKWLGFAESDHWEVDEQREKIRKWRSQFELTQDNVFGIFDRDDGGLIGSIGYHKRVGIGGIEIGYWTRSSKINQGYMTESVRALTKLAFQHYQFDRVEIHCQPENLASAAIPKKLGFEFEATLKKRVLMSSGFKDLSIFTLFREDFEKDIQWNEISVKGFDRMDVQIYPISLQFGELDPCCGL